MSKIACLALRQAFEAVSPQAESAQDSATLDIWYL